MCTVPVPDPVPAPAVDIKIFPGINKSRMLIFDSFSTGGRYERFQRLQVLSGAVANVSFLSNDIASGGVVLGLLANLYTLLVDGEARATVSVVPGAILATFKLNLAGITDGWHRMSVVGDPSESPVPWMMFVNKALAPVTPSETYVVSGTWEMTHYTYDHAIIKLPAVYKPTVMTLAPRVCVPFSSALPRTQLFRENLVPYRDGSIHRLNVNPQGVLTTFNEQNYFFSDLIGKLPAVHLLDGLRGVGTAVMTTHMMVDRHGGVYCCDPWRWFTVSLNGTVRTRFGWVHEPIVGNWQTPGFRLKLVGDWSAVPVERRGPHEMWGGGFVKSSLALDPDAPPQGGEQPHLNSPRLLATDSQRNRVLCATFTRDDFSADPVVTEFITGMHDPWDLVEVDGIVYVSERKANRISKWDATTGAPLGTFIEGLDLAFLDGARTAQVKPGVTLAMIREQPCVMPEGLFHLDGWIYFCSKVMQQVRRKSIATGEVQTVCSPAIDGNSRFMKISVGTGTFGPRGTVFVSTWSNAGILPQAFLPDGKQWILGMYARLSRGKGGNWDTQGYLSSQAEGMGRFYSASSSEGIVQLSQALPDDPVIDMVKYQRGEFKFTSTRKQLLHGQYGFGFFGLPLPFGEDVDIDYYLEVNGHKKT